MACPGCGNSLHLSKAKDRAYLCDSKEYRYFLQMPTGLEGNDTCLFLMLNPGTKKGGEDRLHRTREKCLKLAAKWGYSRLWTCNLFAIGGTKPNEALLSPDPVGRDNDRHIRQAIRLADKVVLAWGGIRPPRNVIRKRIQGVLHMLSEEVGGARKKLYVLASPELGTLTRDHQPRHPLPQANNLPVETIECRRVAIELVNGRWRLRMDD